MDELTINIGPIEESCTYDGSIFFIVTALVNGEELPDALDVDEFFTSLSLIDDLAAARRRITKARRTVLPTTKRLPLFNCTCGGFGCGGYYVDVEVTPGTLIWTSEFAHSSQHRMISRRRFVFSWRNTLNIVGELIAAIYEAIPQSENGQVTYTATGLDLVERLPFYLERYERLGSANQGGSDA